MKSEYDFMVYIMDFYALAMILSQSLVFHLSVVFHRVDSFPFSDWLILPAPILSFQGIYPKRKFGQK